MNNMEISAIRSIVVAESHLLNADILSATTNLNDAGMTSLARMNVMLALEDHYQIQFPDEMLTQKTFENVETLAKAVSKLLRDKLSMLATYFSLGLIGSIGTVELVILL